MFDAANLLHGSICSFKSLLIYYERILMQEKDWWTEGR